MNVFVFNQTQYLLISALAGFITGLWFGFFRLLRRAFRHSYFAVAFEDVLFFLISAVFYWIVCFAVFLGQIRWYSVIGYLSGFTLYILTLGRLLSALSDAIIRLVRSAVRSLIITPLKKIISFISTVAAPIKRRHDERIRRKSLEKIFKAASRGFR